MLLMKHNILSIDYLITQINFGVNSVAIEMHDSETEMWTALGSTFGFGSSNNNGNWQSYFLFLTLISF